MFQGTKSVVRQQLYTKRMEMVMEMIDIDMGHICFDEYEFVFI